MDRIRGMRRNVRRRKFCKIILLESVKLSCKRISVKYIDTKSSQKNCFYLQSLRELFYVRPDRLFSHSQPER